VFLVLVLEQVQVMGQAQLQVQPPEQQQACLQRQMSRLM
jgi:hypothetical protein